MINAWIACRWRLVFRAAVAVVTPEAVIDSVSGLIMIRDSARFRRSDSVSPQVSAKLFLRRATCCVGKDISAPEWSGASSQAVCPFGTRLGVRFSVTEGALFWY